MPAIRRLLIANRGEIARRIMRTCREMGITTVAVYAEPDATAPFVREADEAVALGGATSTETYLDIEKLIAAAKRAGADAVHPGYGFLSENAAFAKAVIDAGLIWIGPHPDAIALMGDKLAAKQRMAGAGVPLLPGLAVDPAAAGDIAENAREVGFPVLVKAAGGGGGRGMRIIQDAAGLAEGIAAASREAASAFGDERVFLERYLERARHVEVQVAGDRHGNTIHLFERECSIQRRHQKIIEEAPSPAVDPELRERMGAAAVAAALAIGYDNLGTVEFLLDSEGRFYFLEMNTRLQVEHPVTEAITGLDLVREQIRIAEGDPLSVHQEGLHIDGHAIEARLYAEDPSQGFLPTGGTLLAWEPDPQVPVRWDSGVEPGSAVPAQFDPLIAKVIAHARTREEAALKLALALERLRVHGLPTNRDFLVNTLRHPAFLAGDTTTDFIERHQPPPSRELPEAELAHAALAAALAGQEARRAAAPVLRILPSGWRNNPSQPQWVEYAHNSDTVLVRYQRARDGSFAYEIGEQTGAARIRAAELPELHLEIDGLQRRFVVTTDGNRVFVQTSAGEVALAELLRFPDVSQQAVAGGYAAPMPGKVVAVKVEVGESVKAGQVLAILEAMKMEHNITASEDGTVAELRVAAGDQVDGGQVLVVIDAAGDGK